MFAPPNNARRNTNNLNHPSESHRIRRNFIGSSIDKLIIMALFLPKLKQIIYLSTKYLLTPNAYVIDIIPITVFAVGRSDCYIP